MLPCVNPFDLHMGMYLWEDAAFQNWSNSVHFTPFRMSPSVWQRIRKDRSTEGFQTLSVISFRERCCRLGFPSEREFSENDEEKMEGGVESHKEKNKGRVWKLVSGILLLNTTVTFMGNSFAAVKIISYDKFKQDYWRLYLMFQDGMETV